MYMQYMKLSAEHLAASSNVMNHIQTVFKLQEPVCQDCMRSGLSPACASLGPEAQQAFADTIVFRQLEGSFFQKIGPEQNQPTVPH